MNSIQQRLPAPHRRQSLHLQTQPKPIRGLRTAKAWDQRFFQNGLALDRPFIDTVEESNLERSLLNAFLQHTDSAGRSWEVENVERFYGRPMPVGDTHIWTDCRIRNLGSVGPSDDDQHETKWVKVTNSTGTIPRSQIQPTSRISIRRSLIFVPDLTPVVLNKLVTSASWYQAQSLRPAIGKHIAGKTAICVEGSLARGFPTFRLQMHLPCFVLKEASLVDNQRVTQGLSKKICSDLAFLPLRSNHGSSTTKFSILEAHTSVVIAGANHFEWYGYAFGNIGDMSVADEYEEMDDSYNVDPEKGTDDWYYVEAEDFFAAGGCQDTSSSGQSIMDPRIYFLLAMQNRMQVLVQNHEYLVQTLSEGFYSWVDQHSDFRRNCLPDADDHLEEALHCIEGMTRLFRHLRQQFSAAIATWARFSSPRGDILYFEDLRDRNAYAAFHRIEESFEALKDLKDVLNGMIETCVESTQTFTLHLQIGKRGMNRAMTNATQGSAESAKNSERFAEETVRANRVNFQLLTVTTAVVIALQYFCSDRALFQFDRNPTTFWISICILVPSLLVLTYALYAFDHVKAVLLDRVNGKLKEAVTPHVESVRAHVYR
ncbi:hypothetical protein SVAN01_10454 [Stagonosporopsis vannaccii]|nr:hypothetical protein SVAN01_10454 [Stagonosporopsis vannaccii]